MGILTKKEIDEIKSRLEKASPGPWRVTSTSKRHQTGGDYIPDCDDWVVVSIFERKEDAYFVAHAREDIPRLVAEVERLREGLSLIAERYYEYDSPEQLAEVAEYNLNGGDNE